MPSNELYILNSKSEALIRHEIWRTKQILISIFKFTKYCLEFWSFGFKYCLEFRISKLGFS